MCDEPQPGVMAMRMERMDEQGLGMTLGPRGKAGLYVPLEILARADLGMGGSIRPQKWTNEKEMLNARCYDEGKARISDDCRMRR